MLTMVVLIDPRFMSENVCFNSLNTAPINSIESHVKQVPGSWLVRAVESCGYKREPEPEGRHGLWQVPGLSYQEEFSLIQ